VVSNIVLGQRLQHFCRMETQIPAYAVTRDDAARDQPMDCPLVAVQQERDFLSIHCSRRDEASSLIYPYRPHCLHIVALLRKHLMSWLHSSIPLTDVSGFRTVRQTDETA
jgi:hypothetical protein